MATPNELIRAARTRLSGSPDTAYFAPALWAVRIVEDKACVSPGAGSPTMGVSEDWTLYYHPECAKWPLDTLETVWLHEIWHLLRSHVARGKSLGVTDQQQLAWNVAADCEINDGLVEAKRPFPPGCSPCLPAMLGKPDNLTAEEYYAAARQQSKAGGGSKQGQGSGQIGGSCADGRPRPWEKPTGEGKPNQPVKPRPVPGELIKRQIAESMSKVAGKLPGSWQRWANTQLVKKTIPWDVVFRSVVGRIVAAGRREEYTYSLLPRRRAFGDFILPGHTGTVPDVCVGIDTSGSMAENQLGRAIDILEDVLAYMGHSYAVTVVTCDAAIQATKKVMSGRNLPLSGGGGTDMGTLIDHVKTLKPTPQILVLITDCHTPWPERAPVGMNVVILRVGSGEGPAWCPVVDARDTDKEE